MCVNRNALGALPNFPGTAAVVLRKCTSDLRSVRREVVLTKHSAEYQYWRNKPKSVASIAMIRFQTLAIVLVGEMPLLKKSKINVKYKLMIQKIIILQFYLQ